jgi:hypothetical protein
MSKGKGDRPPGFVMLPSHAGVRVYGQYRGGSSATIEYEGAPEALIESGIATAEMLSGRYPGRKRLDATGHHFRLQRSFRLEDGSPRAHCKVTFLKPLDFIDRMPAARQAIYAGERIRRWYSALADGHCTADEQRAAVVTADILARFATRC